MFSNFWKNEFHNKFFIQDEKNIYKNKNLNEFKEDKKI